MPVSEQSPWGAPPPTGPGPAGPTPPYGQQPGAGWNGGPPSYGVPLHGGPQGPQGPRKRTGLVVGLVVLVVLLVGAAFAVTLLVVGNDDDGPDEASSSGATSEATSSAPTDEPSSDDTASSAPATDDPSTATAPPAGSGDIVGNGYSYDLPAAGWKDATDDAKGLAETIDTAIILGSSINLSQSSIIVEALPSGGASSLEDLEALWKRNLASTDDATPVDIDDREIAGDRAIGVRIDDRKNNAGVPIRQIAYLVLHDDMQYSIGLSFPKSGDDVSEGDFEKMLSSWAWSD